MNNLNRPASNRPVFHEVLAEDREHFQRLINHAESSAILRLQPIGPTESFLKALRLATKLDTDRMRIFIWHLDGTEFVIRIVMGPAYAPNIIKFAWSEAAAGGRPVFTSSYSPPPGLSIPQLHARGRQLPTIQTLSGFPGFRGAVFNPTSGTYNSIYDHAEVPQRSQREPFRVVCELHQGYAMANSLSHAQRIADQNTFCSVCRLWNFGHHQ